MLASFGLWGEFCGLVWVCDISAAYFGLCVLCDFGRVDWFAVFVGWGCII